VDLVHARKMAILLVVLKAAHCRLKEYHTIFAILEDISLKKDMMKV
jgi:hypothetical protein